MKFQYFFLSAKYMVDENLFFFLANAIATTIHIITAIGPKHIVSQKEKSKKADISFEGYLDV